MTVTGSIRSLACTGSPGEGAVADSPSFIEELTSAQFSALADFAEEHGFYACSNCETYADPTWGVGHGDLLLLEVVLSCPVCCITRTFDRDGKEVI